MTNETYFVRHGEWKYESDGESQRLTFAGKRQAVKAARELMGRISENQINVYSSPVRRVHETAKFITETMKRDGRSVNLEIVLELGENFGLNYDRPSNEVDCAYQTLKNKLDSSNYPVVAVTHDTVIQELYPEHKAVVYCEIVPINMPTERDTSWGDL